MNYIDFIILVSLVIFVLASLKKGILTILVELVGYIIAVPVSLSLSKQWAEPFYTRFVQQHVVDQLSRKLSEAANPDDIVRTIRESVNKLPFSLDSLGDSFGVDISGSLDSFLSHMTQGNYAQSIADSVLKPVFIVACTAVLFLAVLVAFLIVVKIAARLLSKIRLPRLFKTTNKIFGGAFGLIKGCVIIMIVCAVVHAVTLAASFKSGEIKFLSDFNQSVIVQKVNDFNPILEIIK